MKAQPAQVYQTRILPALQRLQQVHGFLPKAELERLAVDLDVPLYRIQEVASFFPHFWRSLPPPATLHVCRDMACHMAGSAAILDELSKLKVGQAQSVKGVSCIGRCDRAPAAYLSVANDAASPGAARDGSGEDEHEMLLLGRTAEQLKQAVHFFSEKKGDAPQPDRDSDLPSGAAKWKIDPYADNAAEEYAAARKAIAVRDASLRKAGEYLEARPDWPRGGMDLFQLAALGRLDVDPATDSAVSKAVLAWQTNTDWAQGPELGDWSDLILREFENERSRKDREKTKQKGKEPKENPPAGEKTAAETPKEKKGADLRGMGGAGMSAAQKWIDVREEVRRARLRGDDDRAFIVVNGDESEPGTFKDRELLLRVPHLIVEGVILAGLVTEACQGFIYIRHEYGEQIEACRKAIRRAEELGLCGLNAWALGRAFPVSVFVSPGGYICGEQSALIEAMSDRRAEPRNAPPSLATNGLDDRPTLVSNVETFAWAPCIWLHGGENYAGLGVNDCRGRRFFSVCGDVKRPGVYEVPMGLTLRELIDGDEYCQGISGDRKLKAFAPSGPSGGFLPPKFPIKKTDWNESAVKAWERFAGRRGFDPAVGEIDLLDMELELNLFRAYSPTAALGAGLVVYAEGRDMAEQAVNANAFFRNETCGKCVPCRIGAQKYAAFGANLLEKRIGRDEWDRELRPLLKELGEAMELTSICGLGKSVPQPFRTVEKFFDADLDRHLIAQSTPGGKRGE